MDRPIISLLSDFGLSDPYVGIMKGIIAGIAPQANLIDQTHLVAPQNIRSGALILDRAYRYFPMGTIHLAVIDPGVGSNRRAIAIRTGHFLFVGPDNGLFSLVIKRARETKEALKICELENPRYRLEPVSPVFHGRDLFAPAAAHLANGAAVEDFGRVVDRPIMINFPNPKPSGSGWIGEVWAVDHFGSLETNVHANVFREVDLTRVKIKILDREITGIVNTFADKRPGELMALINSAGRLSICIANGSAQKYLNATFSTPVEVSFNR